MPCSAAGVGHDSATIHDNGIDGNPLSPGRRVGPHQRSSYETPAAERTYYSSTLPLPKRAGQLLLRAPSTRDRTALWH